VKLPLECKIGNLVLTSTNEFLGTCEATSHSVTIDSCNESDLDAPTAWTTLILSVGNHVYFSALRGLAPTGGTTLYILSIAPFIALQSSLLQPSDKFDVGYQHRRANSRIAE
jgi:hypothetical protein